MRALGPQHRPTLSVTCIHQAPGDHMHINVGDTFAQIHSSGSEFSSLKQEKLRGLLVRNLVCFASVSVQSGAHHCAYERMPCPLDCALAIIHFVQNTLLFPGPFLACLAKFSSKVQLPGICADPPSGRRLLSGLPGHSALGPSKDN